MRYIAPAIRAGLDCLEITPHQLTGISCVQGPGSFTGIRMVFAHVHGISMAASIPMSSISYFDTLIHGPGKLLQGPAWIFIHSRRNQVYAMKFSLPTLRRITAPVNINLENIGPLVNKVQGQVIHAFGSGVRKNPDYFTADYWNILPETWDIPLPQSLLKLSIKAEYTRRTSFPEYLRPSDAEENLQVS